MYIWMPVVAVILFLQRSECQCQTYIEPSKEDEKIPVFRDSVTATNFSFVARSSTDFELWWNVSCDSWNQDDVITFTFKLNIDNSNDVEYIQKNFTSCRSKELFTWNSPGFIKLNISFQNATSRFYCYDVEVNSFVLAASKLKRIAVDATNMSFRDKEGYLSGVFNCILKYKEYPSTGSDWKQVSCSSHDIGCSITALKPAKNYSVKMACGYLGKNKIQPISWSDSEVFSTPEAAPSETVRNVHTETVDFGYRRSINVSWQPVSSDNQNGQILFYTISVHGKKCDTQVRAFNTSTLSYILPDLYYRCDYRINISASNTAGSSTPWVKHLDVMNKIPSEARSFTAISISNDSIQLSWKVPERPYGEVNYNLSVFRINNGIKQRVETVSITGSETGQGERYLVTGLTPFTRYHLNLVAVNHAFASEGVQLEETTSESVPSESPSGLILAHVSKQVTNLSVSWGPVPEDQRNGDIKSYTIYWWQQDNSTTCQPAPPLNASYSTVNESPYIIEDLEEDTPYCVTVAASTSVGEGPKAKVETIRTQRATVTVSNITVTSTTSESIRLEWNLPPRIKATLLQLQIYHNEVTNSFKLGKGQTSHTLRKLKPYTNYSISLQACWDDAHLDSCGDNSTVYARTNSTYPSEPTNLIIRQLAQDHVNLSWHPPLQSNGPISHYQVTYFQDAQSSLEEKRTELLTMSVPFPCSTIGKGRSRLFVFHVSAVVDGLKGPSAKHNTTMCRDTPRVSDLVIAWVVIPGFVICLFLALVCWCALAPRKKIEIKHAKAIYEPEMVSSCAKVPEKEKFDTLKCQPPTKLETDCETYVIMGPQKYTTVKTSTSKQSYIQMSRGGGYLPNLT